MTIVESRAVTGGVCARHYAHVAAALDGTGEVLGVAEFPSTPAGCQAVLDWLAGFGPVRLVAIEADNPGAAGLIGYLHAAGVRLAELDVANSDDAVSCRGVAVGVARAALSGGGRGLAQGNDSLVEAITTLVVATEGARAARAATVERIREVLDDAPDDLRARFADHPTMLLVTEAAALVPGTGHPLGCARRAVLGELGRRAVHLGEELDRLGGLLVPLVAAHAGGLLAAVGVGGGAVAAVLAAVDDSVA